MSSSSSSGASSDSNTSSVRIMWQVEHAHSPPHAPEPHGGHMTASGAELPWRCMRVARRSAAPSMSMSCSCATSSSESPFWPVTFTSSPDGSTNVTLIAARRGQTQQGAHSHYVARQATATRQPVAASGQRPDSRTREAAHASRRTAHGSGLPLYDTSQTL